MAVRNRSILTPRGPSASGAGHRVGPGRFGLVAKRTFDVCVSTIALVVAGPLMVVIALLILIDSGRPVWFRQRRIGKDERPFVVIKFRTMVPNARDVPPGAHRVTRIGRPLRLSGLDELPQLANVLRGEMSLVGPRPLLEEYLPYYRPSEQIRHRMRPGLTGMAQVIERHGADWDRRLSLDARYVREWSPALDAWILLRTIRAFFTPGGAQIDESATLPPLNMVRASDHLADS